MKFQQAKNVEYSDKLVFQKPNDKAQDINPLANILYDEIIPKDKNDKDTILKKAPKDHKVYDVRFLSQNEKVMLYSDIGDKKEAKTNYRIFAFSNLIKESISEDNDESNKLFTDFGIEEGKDVISNKAIKVPKTDSIVTSQNNANSNNQNDEYKFKTHKETELTSKIDFQNTDNKADPDYIKESLYESGQSINQQRLMQDKIYLGQKSDINKVQSVKSDIPKADMVLNANNSAKKEDKENEINGLQKKMIPDIQDQVYQKNNIEAINTEKINPINSDNSTKAEIKSRALEIPDKIVEYIKLVKSNNDNKYHSVTIQIDPPNLGKIKLRVLMKDSKMIAEMEVTNLLAKEIIETQLPDIKKSLMQYDIKFANFNISYEGNSSRFSTDDSGFSQQNKWTSGEWKDNDDKNSEEEQNSQKRQYLGYTNNESMVDFLT